MTELPNEAIRYTDATVLVVGASGFIGRWVARKLSDLNARLILVVRNRSRAETIFDSYGVRGEVHEIDLSSDAGRLVDLCRTARPAISFNVAGYGVKPTERDRDLSYQLNADLPERLGYLAAESLQTGWTGQHVINTGTALEYGSATGNLFEDSEPRPTTVYGQSALAGTSKLATASAALGIRALTARLFTVYGPGEHDGRLLPSLLESARSGTTLRLTAGLQRRDFTYVEDVAEGLLRLGLTAQREAHVVNLASGRLTSVREFVRTAASCLSLPGSALQFGALPTRSEEMEHSPVAVGLLSRLVGWTPQTSLEEGIRKTVRFSEQPSG